jgi:hypothetical protein
MDYVLVEFVRKVQILQDLIVNHVVPMENVMEPLILMVHVYPVILVSMVQIVVANAAKMEVVIIQ